MKRGSPPKEFGWRTSGLAEIESLGLSHGANGLMKSGRSPRGKTARAVWRLDGAQVARQRCRTFQPGTGNTHVSAVGCKALNATLLGAKTMYSTSNSLG
jgi:hypothetical protein